MQRIAIHLTAVLGSVFIFLSSAAPGSAYPPPWLQAHMRGRLQMPDSYHGVGFAAYKGNAPDYDSMKLAKDRALDELCYQLSVSIQSELKDQIVKHGDFEAQQISSSLFVSSRKVLSGVKEKQRWTDPDMQRHWVLLAVDKNSADEQLHQQGVVNEVVDRLENKQDEILAGNQRIARLLEQQMAIYQDQMKHYGQLLEKIDTKVGAASVQTRQEYASIRLSITSLEDKQKQISNQQALQIDELMRQNQMLKHLLEGISENIQKDYFLTLADDDVKHKSLNPEFWVQIEPGKGQGATYFSGEKIRYNVKASRGSYIKVIYLSSTGNKTGSLKRMNTLLFPNVHDRNNWIRAGEVKTIGRYGELEIQPPYGQDVITVVASEQQFSDLDQTLKHAQGGYYSEVTANTRGALQVRTRGIAVARPAPKKSEGGAGKMPAAEAKITSDTCFIVSEPKP
jgi:hypothetical protein